MLNSVRLMAKKCGHPWAFHVAIITKGGAVIAKGFNHGWTHAEIAALKSLWPNKRKGCKLYSYRITRTGKFGMARPCENCRAQLKAHGITTVTYTNTFGQQVTERL